MPLKNTGASSRHIYAPSHNVSTTHTHTPTPTSIYAPRHNVPLDVNRRDASPPFTLQTSGTRYCKAMRHYGALTCGLSSKWWSEKHNLHHAFTNVIGADEDIIVRIGCILRARA